MITTEPGCRKTFILIFRGIICLAPAPNTTSLGLGEMTQYIAYLSQLLSLDRF